VTVMAKPTSKSGTAHFTPNSYHVIKYYPSFFMSEPRIFVPFLQIYSALCHMSVLVFNVSANLDRILLL
jgi:hypothetical protein